MAGNLTYEELKQRVSDLEQRIRELDAAESKCKQAEESLRESNELIKIIMNFEAVGMMFWDLTTGCMTDPMKIDTECSL